MSKANVWVEKVKIPTYGIGAPEKAPMFLEKRVYQGSCGKVYPYPTVESMTDEKKDKEYTAVYLENEYIKVMVLPELGGRIQRAYDKTNDYDFVYYNRVIKPALVGLTGPWISGGIEFNWPQHHRPTTFSPTDYITGENEDGSCYVMIHDVDQMYGTKGIMKFTLYPGKAYIEIMGQLYNRTSLPQTFLWWANPAVAVNDYTQSIFPPDVHAVMDHGKRDVSKFPIADGVYYKHDYSAGVDISRYKNIPVPTSYMAEKSKYDFVGGYDYSKEAGLLHVADHHVSPGKKQWTWGNGDFGQAWDRNLTDEDGPYIELMTGMFTDNQPDFTWLKPFEEKTFTQYFMPYKTVGQVKNATREAAVGLEYDGKEITMKVYATGVYPEAEVILSYAGEKLFGENVKLSPIDTYTKTLEKEGLQEDELIFSVWADGECLVSYQPEKWEEPEIPEPAKAAREPEEIATNEELYLTGLHIEQYRHATYLPDPYYLEGLKRDPGDIRINNAYGELLMRRGCFAKAQKYFEKALERMTYRNPNPFTSESYYLLGLTLFYQNRLEESYDAFYKATWSSEQQEMSFYYLAAISAKRGKFAQAYELVEKALVKNAHNIKARGLKAYLLRKLGKNEAALIWIAENLRLDPFDFVSGYEQVILQNCCEGALADWKAKMRDFKENYLMTARDYAEFGAYGEAIWVLDACTEAYPMIPYYMAYYRAQIGAGYMDILTQAENADPSYCFPNKLEDIAVLSFAINNGENCAKACYYLACLYYDKRQYEEAIALWEKSAKQDETYPLTHRNLSIAYYNKEKDAEKALVSMNKAFALDTTDVRMFLELDQLRKKMGCSFEERLAEFEKHIPLVDKRDDLYIEYITLLNMTGQYQQAYGHIMKHHFHPWEGGEGKVTGQYVLSLLQLAKADMAAGNYESAKEKLEKAFTYPHNLGEGKLEGCKDNHLYYHLGLVEEALGNTEKARECFELATLGTDEPAGVMYYNDQPADRLLYQGLAHLKLGQRTNAQQRFHRLTGYGEKHLEDEVKIEYFAVSLPDLTVFEDDYTLRNRAHCNYLIGLGNLGMGNQEIARKYFAKAAELESAHQMSRIYSL
ncbi:MAG: DUF5107 domain-containing protein [Lachnospiraceae bacterium]|nr:DUF5107 domain-containing protein [Lachnospiraceae bacterium]